MTLKGHSLHIPSIAFSHSGDRLASIFFDNTARIWDMHTGALLATLTGHTDAVCSIAFSPRGDRLATGSVDSTIRLWNVVTGAEISRLDDHPFRVTSVTFSPNGDRLVSGSTDQTIRLWDVQPGVELAGLECHSDMVDSVQFSPKGDRLVSGSWDSTVRLWNVHSGAEVATLTVGEDPNPSFSFDGRYVEYRCEGRKCQWDVSSFPSTTQADSPLQSLDSATVQVLWDEPWITYNNQRLCYLGAQVVSSDSSGALIALGAGSGEVFLLDFTRMICRIRELNVSYPHSHSESHEDT
ncbi:hypothetical protein FRB95_013411 [Tulasnella sp. JGI-2019a]|nr:hypothetical protein FRB95_013411 [Tulasnella sp. JGI-2019a]